MHRLLILAVMAQVAGCAAVYEPGVSVQPPVRTLDPTGAVSSTRTAPSMAVETPEYRIHAGDQVSIRFPLRPAYNDIFTVRADGRITPPMLGSLVAASLTTDELRDRLVERYRRQLVDLPPASVRIYRLQASDTIELRFSFFPDLNTLATIRPDGRISLPMVGELVAEGLTPSELQAQLAQRYKGKVPNADLTVSVKQSNSNVYYYQSEARQLPDPGLTELSVNLTKTAPLVVFVGGEVPAPGIQPYMPGVNVLQTIYAAGGPTTTSDMRSVVILRRGPDDSMIRVVADLTQDLSGTGTGNLDIRPFDVVVLPRSAVARAGDTLDQYLYRIVRPLANGSVVFNFTRQLGTLEQKTTVLPP